jgi:flavocytochrome c
MLDVKKGDSAALAVSLEQADVVVIGSGFAGLAAAIEAAETGCSVAVLEKMMAFGGNSAISDGGIAAPGIDYQIAAGINDSPELMYEDLMKAGEGLNYPELARMVAENAQEAFVWARDKLRVKYFERVDIFGGHTVPRCYTPETISGLSLIQAQVARLRELGVPLFQGVYLKALMQNEQQRVTGVKVIDGYRFNKPLAGKELNIFTRRAVVIASGGFGSDVAFRQAQDPRLNSSVQSTNKLFATAETLKECMRLGANPVQLSRIQLGPWASPDEKGYGVGPLFGDYVVFPYGIMVDPVTGSRFVNELCDRRKLAEEVLSRKHPVIGIADSRAVDLAGWDLSRCLSKGVVKTFQTLDNLAANCGINAEALKQAVSTYNSAVREGADREFQKQIMPEAEPIARAPFYAMRMWPKVHYTMGGIQIDEQARVINRDMQPIEGLFAAGEVTGGIHGASRLGSCSITECLVFGRIAGRSAAAVRG